MILIVKKAGYSMKIKETLIEEMKRQRFLPITENTFQLYKDFAAIVDSRNPEELAQLLFYEGEYFFRIGSFDDATNCLTRCINAPKQKAFKRLEALSYNILGMISHFLGLEAVAINCYYMCRSISEAYGFTNELMISCINLGSSHTMLENYDTALAFFDEALSHSREEDVSYYVCQVYRAMVFYRSDQKGQTLSLIETLKNSPGRNNVSFANAAFLNLSIRIHLDAGEEDLFLQSFSDFLNLLLSNHDFLEASEFYFDACSYLLSQNRQKELRQLLNALQNYTIQTPIVFLQYQMQKYETDYAFRYLSDWEYSFSCSEFMTARFRYLEEQRKAKLSALKFIENRLELHSAAEGRQEKNQTDQLTGLLNKHTIRFLIEEDLTHISKAPSAMILVDLDHFRQINDTLGDLTGDALICQTASVIRNYFKDSALCGRIGGDEFLIYLSAVKDPDQVLRLAELLRQEIYWKTSQQLITITTQASIGVSFSSETCHNYETMFAAADAALYYAKSHGRNQVINAETFSSIFVTVQP